MNIVCKKTKGVLQYILPFFMIIISGCAIHKTVDLHLRTTTTAIPIGKIDPSVLKQTTAMLLDLPNPHGLDIINPTCVVNQSHNNTGTEPQQLSIGYNSTASQQELLRYYQDQLAWHGWSATHLFNTNETLLIATKKDRTLALSLRPDGAHCYVFIHMILPYHG